MPKSLDRSLAEQSHKEGISMNQYCVYLLAQNNTMYENNITIKTYEEAIENCLYYEKEHHIHGLVTKEKSFVPGDVVYVSNPDKEYEKKYGRREHKSFFGTVMNVIMHDSETYVEVNFPTVPNGNTVEWCYSAKELSPAAEIKHLTLEELENRFRIQVFAKYL